MEHTDKLRFQDATEVQLGIISDEERARERVQNSPLSTILKSNNTFEEKVLTPEELFKQERNRSITTINIIDLTKEIHNAQNESPPST